MRLLGPTLLALGSCLIIQSASADDTLRQLLSSGATTASTYLTFKDHKQVAAAEEDASSFVASGGAIRGPHLEAALLRLRQENPQLQKTDDMALAQAILASPSH